MILLPLFILLLIVIYLNNVKEKKELFVFPKRKGRKRVSVKSEPVNVLNINNKASMKLPMSYAPASDAPEIIKTKIAGISLDNRQSLARALRLGQILHLGREKTNNFDRNAIAIFTDYHKMNKLGYVNKELASKLAPKMNWGINYVCAVTSITGGTANQYYGVNIIIKEIAFNGFTQPSRSMRNHLIDDDLFNSLLDDDDDPEEDNLMFESEIYSYISRNINEEK